MTSILCVCPKKFASTSSQISHPKVTFTKMRRNGSRSKDIELEMTSDITPPPSVAKNRCLSWKLFVLLGLMVVVAAGLALLIIFVLMPDTDAWMAEYVSASKLGRFETAAISTDAAPCAAVGNDLLKKNVSAVDVAIATLVCMGVVNPHSSGLGGGFLMIYYSRQRGTVHYIDAREVAPLDASADMFIENATWSRLGGLSIAVPGELSGYSLAHQRFGSTQWHELFDPSIKMAREGVKVGKALADAIREHQEDLEKFEDIKTLFWNNDTGNYLVENDLFANPRLADTLQVISKINSDALYSDTETSKNFLSDLQCADSLLEEDDLSKYRALLRDPIHVSLRDNMTLYSTSLPGGGPLLGLVLQIMDGYQDLNQTSTQSREGTVLFLHPMVEAFKFAFAKKALLEDDDSDEMKEHVRQLTSPEYADHIRSLIDDSTTHATSFYGPDVTATHDHGGAHVSVVTAAGDAVAATSSINMPFGSMVVSLSTGIILNNQMAAFSNATSERNRIRPGKRPSSSMSPALVVDGNGDVRMSVGGGGGAHIITAVAQVIMRNLWLKEDIKKAIDAPRLHDQLVPNYLEYEKGYRQDILNDLEELGHQIIESRSKSEVMGVTREKNGHLYANADYRKGGNVDGF